MPYAAVDDAQIYYQTEGGGSPLVLLSGTGWSGEHWNLFQVPWFATRFRVIVHDYRGTGRTREPSDRTYSTRLFAQDVASLLDALGIREPVHVLGHSMGGRVAQWLALDYPERVRSLVLAATGPGQIRADQEIVRGLPLGLVCQLVEQGWSAFQDAYQKSRFMFNDPTAEVVERFAASLCGPFGTPVRAYLKHVMARQMHQTTERLSEITCPTLVVVGEADTVVDTTVSHVESSRYLAEHIPGAEWHVLPGAAHMLQLEQPGAFNARVEEFLMLH